MWARAIALTQAAQTAVPFSEAAGARTRDFFPITRAVGDKIPLLRDAVGGFCMLYTRTNYLEFCRVCVVVMDFDKRKEAMAAKPLDNTNEVDMGLKLKDQVAATGGFGHDNKTVQGNPNLHDDDNGKVRPKPSEERGFGNERGPHMVGDPRSEGGLGVGVSQPPYGLS